jgi:hypothetical protein
VKFEKTFRQIVKLAAARCDQNARDTAMSNEGCDHENGYCERDDGTLEIAKNALDKILKGPKSTREKR